MVIERLQLECGEPDMTEWDAFVDALGVARRRGQHRARRQVRAAARRLPVGERGARPRGHLPRPQGQRALGRRRDRSRPRRSTRSSPRWTASSCPAASASAASRARSARRCYARENKVPYFGICLGMQVAVAEFARHVAGLDGANSAEFDPVTEHPVIDLMREQHDVADMGGTMRLGHVPVQGRRRAPRAATRTARSSSTSATATATRSTTRTASSSSRPASSSAGCRPTASSSRWSSCPTTRGSSAIRAIPSSRAVPRVRRRCSATSSARRSRSRTRAGV